MNHLLLGVGLTAKKINVEFEFRKGVVGLSINEKFHFIHESVIRDHNVSPWPRP
jgi:hypothetical protein